MRIRFLIAVLSVLSVCAGYVFAGEGHDHAGGPVMQNMDHGRDSMMMDHENGSSRAVEVGNKICPVSGEKVGEMGDIIKYEYNGRIYNLCCKACAKDFKKDPEKYSGIAEEEVRTQAPGEMSDQEKMGHDHKGSHEDHPGHDHSGYQYDGGY